MDEKLVATEMPESRDRECFVPEHPIDGKIDIPGDFGTVKDFAQWWFYNNMPFAPPHDTEIYRSDDATSMCMFRHGRYQVELYMIFPQPNLPIHEHPGVEVIKYRVPYYPSPEGLAPMTTSHILKAGEAHGAGVNFKEREGELNRGFPLLAFQRWDEGLEMSTVATRWKGETVGPMQEDLIRRFYPDAYVVDGYADVTRKMK